MYDDVRTLIANELKCLHKSVYVFECVLFARVYVCVCACDEKR